MDRVETERVGGGGHARLGIAVLAIGAVAIIAIGFVGRTPAVEQRVEVASPAVARPSPVPSARPSVAPPPVDSFEAFASTEAAHRIAMPFRLVMPAATPRPIAGSIELTGVLDSQIGRVRLRVTQGRTTLATITVPTAVIVRGVDGGVDSRRVFRASIPLPAIAGPAALRVDVASADPADPEPRAFVTVTTTGAWSVGGYGEPVVPGYVVPGDVTTRP